MEQGIQFFSGFTANDFLFLGEAAWRTLLISVVSISLGTILGVIFGWLLYEGKIAATATLAPVLVEEELN